MRVKERPMRVLRRTVYLVALTAALSASVTACSRSAASKPSGASTAAGASTAGSSPQVAAASRQVSFAVSGNTTYGPLDIPAHRAGQHLAAALLLAGSGPTDRNGDDAAANLEPHTLQLI